MKKFAVSISLVLAAASLSLTSCGGDKTTGEATATKASATDSAATSSLNIRYIDSDSLNANYNFAKDCAEAELRAMSRLNQAQQSKASEIQKFAASIDQKLKSNGYLSEASYNADMQRAQKMQADAENYLNNLGRSSQTELEQMHQALMDSVDNFIKIYNATHHYDAILYKQAGVYFNPSLDITDEVVKGLNARYNKVEDKK